MPERPRHGLTDELADKVEALATALHSISEDRAAENSVAVLAHLTRHGYTITRTRL